MPTELIPRAKRFWNAYFQPRIFQALQTAPSVSHPTAWNSLPRTKTFSRVIMATSRRATLLSEISHDTTTHVTFPSIQGSVDEPARSPSQLAMKRAKAATRASLRQSDRYSVRSRCRGLLYMNTESLMYDACLIGNGNSGFLGF